MGEGDGGAVADVVVNVLPVGRGLKLVGHGEHDKIGPGSGFGDAHDLQALGFGLGRRGRALAKRNRNVLGAAVAQIQRMGMALAAVPENGHLHVLDEIHIAIAIVIDAHVRHSFLLRLSGADSIRVSCK